MKTLPRKQSNFTRTIGLECSVGCAPRSVPCSILVVDDENHFLALMNFVFSKRGYHVITAANGVDASEYIGSQTFSAAVLDIKMHPVGGIELLAKIKKRNPVTPVIMITGYPTDETRNECIRLGAGAYMTKPLDLAELEAVINHLVSAPV